MENTTSKQDKARLNVSIAACHESKGELRKSVEACIAGLNLYGLDVSFTPSLQAVEKMKDEIIETQRKKAPSISVHLKRTVLFFLIQ